MAAKPPQLESLRVLAACVRHKNFSRAAEELCLTPSAVSLRIRSLESRLGIKLFVRSGPNLEVTPEGLFLAEKTEDAMSTIQAALDQCGRTAHALRVTCTPTFASRWLVPRLAVYHALPDAQPVALDATDALLAPSKFDVAIRSGIGPWPRHSAIKLLPEQGTPMLSPSLLADGRPLTPRRLLDLPLIPDGRWSRWFELAGLPDALPRFSATRFDRYELEAVAAASGAGVALLSPFFYADMMVQGALIAPFAHVVEGPHRYWALWRQGAPMPRFVRWIRQELAAGPDAARARAPMHRT